VTPAPPTTSAAPVAKRPSLRIEKALPDPVAAPEAPDNAKPSPAAAAKPAPAAKPAVPKGDGTVPGRDALTLAWGDTILDQISPRAKARFRGGHWVDAPRPTFALPTEIHKQRCEEVRLEVQEAISQYFGIRLELTLTVAAGEASSPASAKAKASAGEDVVEDVGDVSELEDAPPIASSAARLLEAFPGAVEEPND
jgi:hypothetical protein